MKTPPPIKKKNDSSSAEYFVHVNEEQMGPYDFDKIKVLIEFKNIDKNTLIWKEGMDDWDLVSNLEEFKIHFKLPEEEKKSPKEKIIKNEKKSTETKINSASFDFIKLFNIISVITLVASCLALIGAVHQFFQFQNNKEIDMSYIMSFSIWGSLISILLSLICVIYLLIKKTKTIKGFISLIVGISAFFLLMHTESTYRNFWRPYWDVDVELGAFYTETQNEAIREGWRNGSINSDSLNELFQLVTVDHAQKIGNQIWKVNNLNVDRFRNGDLIPEARSEEEWIRAGESKQPAWCYYENDSYGEETYGKLYNWYAVNDPRGLAPEGWHIPTKSDWEELIDYLGGEKQAAKSLLAPTELNGNDKWHSGFSAILVGYRNYSSAVFNGFGETSSWWSSVEKNEEEAYDCIIFYNNYEKKVLTSSWFKSEGKSIRCIKD